MSRLIVIEGIDAAGKATQTKLLTDRLAIHASVGATSLAFPRYETPLGRAILRHLQNRIAVREEHSIDSSDHRIDGETVYRRAPEDAFFFHCAMLADKYDAVPIIRDYLSVGTYVVCDRYWPSAYAFGAADGLDKAWLVRAHDTLPQPDLYIFLDLSPEEAQRRRPELRDRFERDRARQAVVRSHYKTLWQTGSGNGLLLGRLGNLGGRWVTVDASASAGEIHERIWAQIVALNTR